MTGFGNLSVGQRIAVLVGALLALMSAVAAAGYVGSHRLSEASLAFVGHEFAATVAMGDLREDMAQLRRHEKDMLINSGRPDIVDGYLADWRARRARIDDDLRRLGGVTAGFDAGPALQRIGERLHKYDTVFERMRQTLQKGGYDSAAEGNDAMIDAKTAFHQAEADAKSVNDVLSRRAAAASAEVATVSARSRLLVIAGWMAGALCGVVLGVLVARTVILPLRRSVDVALAVAQGDLSCRVAAGTRDECGRLLQALGDMTQGLAGLVGCVRESALQIERGTGEIASGNVDLSRRTEQQAANLEETSASMEQLGAAVQTSAASSRSARRLAEDASAAATESARRIHHVVEAMHAMTRDSTRIAEIVGVIEGLAFQTNILALNAAVESARAGEQGRGFAVVATEVRTLAQRSAAAAKEIAAVVREEHRSVEAARERADAARGAMETLDGQVREMTALVNDISQSCAEQDRGIRQVVEAVGRLDQATQGNAALVEHSAASTHSLDALARRLVASVEAFRLEPAAG
jgi:methyl-accepting chemotaxis protein